MRAAGRRDGARKAGRGARRRRRPPAGGARPPPPRALAALLLLALPALLAGCIEPGSESDLELVCEGREGSPAKAYPLDFLVAATTLDEATARMDEATARAVLEAARGHVITMGGEPHAGFRATLTRHEAIEGGGGFWRFHGVGTWDDGPADHYVVTVSERDGRMVATPDAGPDGWGLLHPFPEPVQAPASVRAPALAAVNATPEAKEAWGETQELKAAGWDPELPGCVHLHAAGGKPPVPRDAERLVVVNVGRGRVVHVETDAA